MNMAKYGVFSGEPPQSKNEVQYDQWIFKVEESWKTYEDALVWEAIIHSLKGKAVHTIHYLEYNTSALAMLDKLNIV